jgi:leucyl-tRNA synthetase
MLSDSPPERDVQWTEEGVEGAWRFSQRFWRIVQTSLPQLSAPMADKPVSMANRKSCNAPCTKHSPR